MNIKNKYEEFMEKNYIKKLHLEDGTIWNWIQCLPNKNSIHTKSANTSLIKKSVSKNKEDLLNKNKKELIVFITSIAGTIIEYFIIMNELAEHGYHVISVECTNCQDINLWGVKLNEFFREMNFENHLIHLFGCDIGAYISLIYTKEFYKNVKSLILCNPIVSLQAIPISYLAGSVIFLIPHFILSKIIMDLFTVPESHSKYYNQLIEAYNFMYNNIQKISQIELASKLNSLLSDYIIKKEEILIFDKIPITIISSLNSSLDSFNSSNFIELFKNKKIAQLKFGGDFPHLSNPNDVSVFCLLHLQNCNAKKDIDHVNTPLNTKDQTQNDNLNLLEYNMPYPEKIIYHESQWTHDTLT